MSKSISIYKYLMMVLTFTNRSDMIISLRIEQKVSGFVLIEESLAIMPCVFVLFGSVN